MSRTLVTVKGSRHTTDLELPADAPVQELMALLLTIGEDMTPEMIAMTGSRWGLGLEGGLPFNGQLTLETAGVFDGAILVLQPLDAWDGHGVSDTTPLTIVGRPQPEAITTEHQGLNVRWGNAPIQ